MRTLIIINFCVIAIFFGITFWLSHENAKIISVAKQTQANDLHILEAQRKIVDIKQLLTSTEGKRQQAKNRILSEKDISSFFAYVNSLAAKYGVTATFSSVSNQQQPNQTSAASDEVKFDMTIVSNDGIKSIKAFVFALEHGAYIVTIKEYSFSSVASSSSNQASGNATPAPSGNAQGKIDLTVYVTKATN